MRDGVTCEQANCAIPAVSEWDLIAMSLLFLTAGTIVIRRRRRVPATM